MSATVTERPLVVVTNPVHAEVRDRLGGSCRVDMNEGPEPWPRSELIRRCESAEGLLAFMTDHIDAAFLEACPRLRVVACALKGSDNFDVTACEARGIALSRVPDLLTAPTAELAVGLMIALGRHIRAGDAAVRSGDYAGWRPVLYGTGLDGANIGIIGMGAVGQAIARRLSGFECRIVYADTSDRLVTGVSMERRPLDELLAECDWVVVTAPLTPETLHLIDADALAKMRPESLLVNIGRGSVVDEAAIADALEKGTLAGFAADVFEFEDWARDDRPEQVDDRLLQHPNTVFTPHLGSAVAKVRVAIEMYAAEELEAYFEQRPMRGRFAA